ncbi:MAG TPA: nitrile hydratase accessory protein [Chloroflexota bacterium]|nr:nitrile hydratase accessory protein [Chloroflexota bacterium]
MSVAALPRLPRDEGGPVFAEPWQAQAFAIAVKLSEQGHFTWKEWAAALSDTLKAAADRGEPDDGSRYYEYWLATLERLVTAKGLTNQETLVARKDAWIDAYRNTPHGRPVELRESHVTPDRRWILPGLASAFAAYWIIQQANVAPLGEWGAIPQVGLAASAGFGTLLGVRHALEPDHLAAVSTLMTGERSSAKAAWLGACWGLGHTLTLFAAGALLVLLNAEMPAVASAAFEFGVVLMLVGFGVRAIYQGAYGRLAGPTHSHATRGLSIRRWTIARRPLVVGAMHGLAGSGAITALVVATLPSTLTRLSYLALFGIGSTAGMAVLSGLLGWPLARAGGHGATMRSLSLAVGCVSTVLGLVWGYPLIGRLF